MAASSRKVGAISCTSFYSSPDTIFTLSGKLIRCTFGALASLVLAFAFLLFLSSSLIVSFLLYCSFFYVLFLSFFIILFFYMFCFYLFALIFLFCLLCFILPIDCQVIIIFLGVYLWLLLYYLVLHRFRIY